MGNFRERVNRSEPKDDDRAADAFLDADQPRLVQSKGDLTTLQSFGLRRGAKPGASGRNCSDEAAFTARMGQQDAPSQCLPVNAPFWQTARPAGGPVANAVPWTVRYRPIVR